MLAPSNFFKPPKRHCALLNTLRANYLHLFYLLGQRREFKKANKIGRKCVQLWADALKDKEEHYYTC